MQTKTELTWHHVTHGGGIATGLPDGGNRDMLVFTNYNGGFAIIEIETLYWSDGNGTLGRGFWVYRGNGYYTRRDDAYIIAWAELPTPSEVMTDEEKEFYA